MGAYRRYALKPDAARYGLVALLYALGLMAKPQVITFPCVLLLWDYWPLRRMFAGAGAHGDGNAGFPGRSISQLVVEKIPLFALSAVSALITVKAQRAGHAMRLYPLSIRLGNAIVSYASYVKKTFWPVDLSPMYPHPGNSLAKGQVFAALLFLLIITALVIADRRRRYLPTGWLWFVGTLVPMIGLVQVGTQAMADRYAYLPCIGLFLMICWLVADWAERRHVAKVWLGGVGVAVLLALAFVAHQQIGYWDDNITLWTHALQVTRNNWVAEDNLGGALMEDGKLDAAIPHFRAAAAIYPEDPVSHLDIGFYEQQHKNWPQAVEQYQEVLKVTPSPKLRAEAYNNLALIDRELGDNASARDKFQQAVNLSPRYADAWVGLGLAAQKMGDFPAGCPGIFPGHGNPGVGFRLPPARPCPGAKRPQGRSRGSHSASPAPVGELRGGPANRRPASRGIAFYGYNRRLRRGPVTSVGAGPEKPVRSRAGIGLLTSPRSQKFVLGLLLVIATVALYYPVNSQPFANYDDADYVFDNFHVKSGLHWSTVTWAFTTYAAANWHPLTWLSHAADVQFFQLNPAGHHDVNLLCTP